MSHTPFRCWPAGGSCLRSTRISREWRPSTESSKHSASSQKRCMGAGGAVWLLAYRGQADITRRWPRGRSEGGKSTAAISAFLLALRPRHPAAPSPFPCPGNPQRDGMPNRTATTGGRHGIPDARSQIARNNQKITIRRIQLTIRSRVSPLSLVHGRRKPFKMNLSQFTLSNRHPGSSEFAPLKQSIWPQTAATGGSPRLVLARWRHPAAGVHLPATSAHPRATSRSLRIALALFGVSTLSLPPSSPPPLSFLCPPPVFALWRPPPPLSSLPVIPPRSPRDPRACASALFAR